VLQLDLRACGGDSSLVRQAAGEGVALLG
jgi:hypothetical protein